MNKHKLSEMLATLSFPPDVEITPCTEINPGMIHLTIGERVRDAHTHEEIIRIEMNMSFKDEAILLDANPREVLMDKIRSKYLELKKHEWDEWAKIDGKNIRNPHS